MTSATGNSETQLIDAAFKSKAYLRLLKNVRREEFIKIRDLHEFIVNRGGGMKSEFLSTLNITSTSYFSSSYLGVTSGGSSNILEYRKSLDWVTIRDKWRTNTLEREISEKYAIINLCARLFPHDKYDVLIAAPKVDKILREQIFKICKYLLEGGITPVIRSYPSKIKYNEQLILDINKYTADKLWLISTGRGPTEAEGNILEVFRAKGRYINEYGAQDCSIQLYSCKYCNGFHLNNIRSILSIKDSRLYTTDLYSYSQPIVGMNVDDIVHIKSDICKKYCEASFLPVNRENVREETNGIEVDAESSLVRMNPIICVSPNAPVEFQLNAKWPKVNMEERGGAESKMGFAQLSIKVHKNDIKGCRAQLAYLLPSNELTTWSKVHTSLISFILAILMFSNTEEWIDFIEGFKSKWKDSNKGFKQYALELKQLIISMKTPSKKVKNCYLLTFEYLLLVHNGMGAEDKESKDWMQFALSENVIIKKILMEIETMGDIRLIMPLLESFKDHVLLYVWEFEQPKYSSFSKYFKGTNNLEIMKVDEMHRAGHLRKEGNCLA